MSDHASDDNVRVLSSSFDLVLTGTTALSASLFRLEDAPGLGSVRSRFFSFRILSAELVLTRPLSGEAVLYAAVVPSTLPTTHRELAVIPTLPGVQVFPARAGNAAEDGFRASLPWDPVVSRDLNATVPGYQPPALLLACHHVAQTRATGPVRGYLSCRVECSGIGYLA